MTIYEKPKHPDDNTEYFVILSSGNQLREWVAWPTRPTEAMLRQLLCPIVGGDLAHCAVLHHGAMCSMFTDAQATASNKDPNRVATEVLHESHLKRNPHLTLDDIGELGWIRGDAVLFGRMIYNKGLVPPALTNLRRI